MIRTSRLPGFYQKTVQERRRLIADVTGLSSEQLESLDTRNGKTVSLAGKLRAALNGEAALTVDVADYMIENAIGVFGLPLGVAANFIINERPVLVPMVVEEPSVVAAVSFAAKLASEGGGFRTSSTEPVMIGQIQVLDVPNIEAATEAILAARADLIAKADMTSPSIVRRGGGAKGIEVRRLDTAVGPMLIVHLLFDARDAMGANAINTACEVLAADIECLSGGRVNLRILSNLNDRRRARAEVIIPASAFATSNIPDGRTVVRGIVEAQAFAHADPYRAATHNKGILNGVDAVAIATGNDWRAIEAGAHAYAARDGQYRALTDWHETEDGDLFGALEMPLAVGTVGGATKSNPVAQVCMGILDVQSSRELAEIMVSVGLAQNLAALRALATEGIQNGHMALHARQIALAAGATGDMVDRISTQLISEKNIRLERAQELVDQMLWSMADRL